MSNETTTPAVASGVGASSAPAGVSITSPAPHGTDALTPERIAEIRQAEKASVLKGLGFESEAAAKRFLTAAKEAEQARMTEAEKIAARIKELEPLAARAPQLEQRLKAVAESKLAALPEKAREAIIKRAGDDTEKRLELLDLLAESGTMPSQAGGAPSSAVTTAPPAGAPKPSEPETPYLKHQRILKESGQVAADIFYSMNKWAVDKSRPTAPF